MHTPCINPVLLERGRWNRDGRDQSFTEFDLSKTALLIVDMQRAYLDEGVCAEVPVAREIVPNVNAIAAALRTAGGKVVYIQNTYDGSEPVVWTSFYRNLLGRPFSQDLTAALTPGNPLHEIAPQMDRQDGDLVVRKTRFSAFTPGTSSLHEVLQAEGITTVIVTGTLTNCCSEATARDAAQMNYDVIFVSDANATITDEEHNATLGNLYVVYADVVPTEVVLSLIEANAGGKAA